MTAVGIGISALWGKQYLTPREHHERLFVGSLARVRPAADVGVHRVDAGRANPDQHLVGDLCGPLAEGHQARLGKPFRRDAYLSELTTLRDQLKAGLSGTAHQPEGEDGPSVSEISERIKTLKAANTIEATHERVGKRRASAEEPVTARIRRRMEATLSGKTIKGDEPIDDDQMPN